MSAANRPRRYDHGLRSTLALCLGLMLGTARADVIQTSEDFLQSVFPDDRPAAGLFWLSGERKAAATSILGHPYPALRLRYWLAGQTSAWILEEVGKTEPITAGFAIGPAGMLQVRVLVYRESRGGEVRHRFFTDQFNGAGLSDQGGKELNLDRNIDGISGATLSVRALKRLSRLALYLHQQVIADVED